MRTKTVEKVHSNSLQVSVYSNNMDELRGEATVAAVKDELEQHPDYSEIYYVGRGGNRVPLHELNPSDFTVRSSQSTDEYHVVFSLTM